LIPGRTTKKAREKRKEKGENSSPQEKTREKGRDHHHDVAKKTTEVHATEERILVLNLQKPGLSVGGKRRVRKKHHVRRKREEKPRTIRSEKSSLQRDKLV